jgi:hypothetical protein
VDAIEKADQPDRERSRGGSFGSTTNPVQLLADEEVAIDNTGSTSHTFTVTPRGSTNGGTTYSRVLNAGLSMKLSGRGIQQISIDNTDSAVYWSAGLRGTVFAISNPSVAAGSGLAPSVEINLGTENTTNSTATLEMAGFGAAGLHFKPILTGIVLLTMEVLVNVNNTLDNNLTLKPAYGTGGVAGAPAANAAVTGTTFGQGVPTGGLASGANSATNWKYTYSARLALVAGTDYWFDFQFAPSSPVECVVWYAALIAQELPV